MNAQIVRIHILKSELEMQTEPQAELFIGGIPIFFKENDVVDVINSLLGQDRLPHVTVSDINLIYS